MNEKRRYFIAIDGYCTNCKYPVICEAGKITDEVKGLDGTYGLKCLTEEEFNTLKEWLK